MSYNPKMDGTASVIDIFEVQDMNMVWKYMKKGEEYSIWRPMEKEGYYPVTHHITKGHSKPGIGFMMKSSDSDAIAMPESFTLIKKTAEGRNFADEKAFAYIFSVNCPSGMCLFQKKKLRRTQLNITLTGFARHFVTLSPRKN